MSQGTTAPTLGGSSVGSSSNPTTENTDPSMPGTTSTDATTTGPCPESQTECLGECVDCPGDDGVDGVECLGAACVASACLDGFLVCGSTCCAWELSNVEQSGPSTLDVDVAIDSMDRLHVVYAFSAGVMSPSIRRAVYDGFDWSMDDIAGTLFDEPYVDIGISSSDVAHVTYAPFGGTDNVGHAVNSGGGWSVGLVYAGSVGNNYRGSQVAVDGMGRAHIAYREESFMGEIYHAYWDAGTWTTFFILGDLDTGLPPDSFSIETAPNNQPHILFYNQGSGQLGHAVKTGPIDQSGGWSESVVDLGIVWSPAVSISVGNELEVAYYNETDAELRLASRNGVAWEREVIWTDGSSERIAFDHTIAGNAHVAFIDDMGRLLHATRLEDGSWGVSVVDAGTSADWVSIAVDSTARPHILFHDTDYGGVRYATAAPVR